jgi:tetratricopeptide (TPR) repeat protein
MKDRKKQEKETHAYLMKLSKEKLISKILERADDDILYRNNLDTEAVLNSRDKNDLTVLKNVISTAFDPGEFVGYHEVRQYSFGVDRVIGKIENVLVSGNPSDALELVEYAMARANAAASHVDDSSSGCMSDIIYTLGEMHYQACLKSRPEPKKLAHKLFEIYMENFIGIFDDATGKYAVLLGQTGLAEYTGIVEKEFAKIANLSKKELQYNHDAMRVERLMEKLLKSSGDTEKLVEFKSRKLEYPYNYLEIAELYKAAGNSAKAIEWAENGIKKFPDRPDGRVREVLAEEYLGQGRKDEAMGLIWVNFAERPNQGNYKVLKEFAERMDRWLPLRESAMEHLRKNILVEKEKVAKAGYGWPTHNTSLIEILIWENKLDEAWKEANEGNCLDSVWYTFAEKFEKERPLDAVFAYKKIVPRIIDQKTKRAYRDAADYVGLIRELLVKNGKENEFKAYLEEIRAKNKAKTSFIKILDRKKWG